MGLIVNPINERNLLFVSSHLDVLAIDDENAIAVLTKLFGHLKTIGQQFQLVKDANVCLFWRQLVLVGKFTKRNPFNVFNPEHLFFSTMVNRKRASAALTKQSF